MIMINQQRITYEYITTEGPPKTRASRRTIALDATTVRLLRANRCRQAKERLEAGDRWVDSGYVFTYPAVSRSTRTT